MLVISFTLFKPHILHCFIYITLPVDSLPQQYVHAYLSLSTVTAADTMTHCPDPRFRDRFIAPDRGMLSADYLQLSVIAGCVGVVEHCLAQAHTPAGVAHGQ